MSAPGPQRIRDRAIPTRKSVPATVIPCHEARTPDRYTRRPVSTLYFAYASLLEPGRLSAAAPGAAFKFTAHFPETRLVFVESDQVVGLPTLSPESGHTVWGAVFEVPDSEVGSLTEAEESQGRVADWDAKAVDREGNKYQCLTFVAKNGSNASHGPDADLLEAMIKGARHWSLPAGWVMGLEDLGEDL
jgi:cation transport regulator ChaC